MALWDALRKKPAGGSDGELQVWMDPMEFSQVLAVLHTLAARTCVEWGCGGSTKAVLAACPFIERYVSVEHYEPWYAKVRDEVKDRRLELHLVPPDKPLPPGEHSEQTQIEWNARAETERELMKTYVDTPASLGVCADFALVDGRARRFCIAAAFDILRPGGVVILHDAQREQYHDALRALGEPHFFEPWAQGQVAMLRKPE